MQWLMIAGGAPSYVIVLFGLLAILAAIGFAREPVARKLPHLGALSAAVLLSSICGVATDLAAVSWYVDRNADEIQDKLGVILAVGIGESMAPLILGTALLSIVALVSAIGFRRMAR